MRPYYSMYYLTDWCNAKCSFCNIWENPAFRPSSLDRVRRDISDLKRVGVRMIDFTGGEPLLRREAPSIFQAADELGMRWGFTNNGTMFEKRWPEMREATPFMVSFSLDSPVPSEHETNRDLPGNFEQIRRSVALAREGGWPINIIFTLTAKSLPRIEEMLELGRKWDCPILLNPLFAYKEVGGGLRPEELRAVKKYAWDRNATLHRGYFDWLADNGGNHITDRTCRSMDTHVVVAPDSSLYVPCYHYAKFRMPTPQGIYAAVTSAEWAELAKMAGRYDFCEGCAINCYLEHGYSLRHPASSAVDLILTSIKVRR